MARNVHDPAAEPLNLQTAEVWIGPEYRTPEPPRPVSIFQPIEDAFQHVGSVLRDVMQGVWDAVRSAWRSMPDEVREAAAIRAGRRYWTDRAGRTRRTRGARPLLHNGRKPRK